MCRSPSFCRFLFVLRIDISFFFNIYFVILSIFVRCANPHKITIYYIYDIRTHGGCCHVAFLHACTNTQTRKLNRSKTSYFALSTDFLYTLTISIGSRNLPKSTKILGRFCFVFSFRIFSVLVFFHVCTFLFFYCLF